MKSLLRKVIPGLLLIAMLSSSAWAQGRVATVDLRKVFDGYWKTKKADATLKDRAADMEKEHKGMLDDWKKAKDDYQTLLGDANNQALSPDEREKRKKSAEDKLKQIKETEETIQQYERQARTTLDEQKKRMRDSLVEEIRAALNGMAKSSGYSLVLDTAAESINGTPIVIYSNGENDVTDNLLRQMNATAPVETTNVDEKKSDTKSEKKKDEKKK
jgi:Skp family chaperone for outer membrane proteins